jgi:hypothetical protein
MAQYAIFLYAPAPGGGEADSEHKDYAEELARSGTMLAAFELESADTATSLRGDAVTDGPFIETKEVIAGFDVIEAPDLDVALQVARQNPILHQGGRLEVRPVAHSTLAAK